MKRYFVCPTSPPPWTPSPFHFIDLPGGGSVVVMMQGELPPDPSWVELPHLLDPGTPMAAAHATKLSALNVGITPGDSTFKVATKLATIHSLFHP